MDKTKKVCPNFKLDPEKLKKQLFGDPLAILHEIPKKQWFKDLSFDEWCAFMEKLTNTIEKAFESVQPLYDEIDESLNKIRTEGDKELQARGKKHGK